MVTLYSVQPVEKDEMRQVQSLAFSKSRPVVWVGIGWGQVVVWSQRRAVPVGGYCQRRVALVRERQCEDKASKESYLVLSIYLESK